MTQEEAVIGSKPTCSTKVVWAVASEHRVCVHRVRECHDIGVTPKQRRNRSDERAPPLHAEDDLVRPPRKTEARVNENRMFVPPLARAGTRAMWRSRGASSRGAAPRTFAQLASGLGMRSRRASRAGSARRTSRYRCTGRRPRRDYMTARARPLGLRESIHCQNQRPDACAISVAWIALAPPVRPSRSEPGHW